ncbi:MAG TPA: MFS transporter [Jatrophihabitantaceae bacterium]|jgi:MFS family permease
MANEGGDAPATYREVLAVGEFRALWIAQMQSRFGDQMARVAIAVLVFERTDSPLLTALTYALTFLPPLVSAPLLAGLADRYPRRTVYVAAESFRALVVALMAIPAMPLPVVAVLLVFVVSVQPLNSATRNAILSNVLTGDRYVAGMGIFGTTDNIVQVGGFALGGVLVGLVGAHPALAIDAATFAVSMLLGRFGLREHRPSTDGLAGASAKRSVRRGATLIFRDPRLWSLAAIQWMYGFYVAPEGIAVPYATWLGFGSIAGLLMSADPIGATFGMFGLARWVRPASRLRLLTPPAVFAGVPLVLAVVHPVLWLTIVLFAVSGALSSYTMFAHAAFVPAVPDHQRGQAVGLMGAGLQAAQGLGILLAGALADVVSPPTAVAICGGAGMVGCVLVGRVWDRTRMASDEATVAGSPGNVGPAGDVVPAGSVARIGEAAENSDPVPEQ